MQCHRPNLRIHVLAVNPLSQSRLVESGLSQGLPSGKRAGRLPHLAGHPEERPAQSIDERPFRRAFWYPLRDYS